MSSSEGLVPVLHDDPGDQPLGLMTSGVFLVAARMNLNIQSYKPFMYPHFTDDRLEFVRGSSALPTVDYIKPSRLEFRKHLRVARYFEG